MQEVDKEGMLNIPGFLSSQRHVSGEEPVCVTLLKLDFRFPSFTFCRKYIFVNSQQLLSVPLFVRVSFLNSFSCLRYL